MRALGTDGQATWAGAQWRRCAESDGGCNWLVRTSDPDPECAACRLIRRRPADNDETGQGLLSQAKVAERRLLFQLLEHSLPITSAREAEGGLAFDLLSSTSEGEKVVTGHADGIVTIDLDEVGDAYRESIRVEFGEPYRTMLGHFRHEIGHYYWQVIVADSPVIDEFRDIFGDERESYADAIERHYSEGTPPNWQDNFISEYATMHPWEDFAESWAHYLHITDTLQTAASFRMRLGGLVGDKLADSLKGTLTTAPDLSMTGYHNVDFGRILDTWHPLALAFNQINRSMGKADLYPFVIPAPVRKKMTFVHEVIGAYVRLHQTEQ
ncbi:putative zinc-binding metallopeptidase [Rarobacter incanus]